MIFTTDLELEQGEMDKPMVGVGNDTSLTPVPHVGDAPVEVELSGMVTSSSATHPPYTDNSQVLFPHFTS